MSRDLLEEALNKTNEIEEKQKRKMRLAESAGRIAGLVVAVIIDATFVWLIVKFMLGFVAFSWVQALGVMFLVNMIYAKFK